MRSLLVPCADSRQIDNRPLFLNYHPDNKLLALKAIEGVYPEKYDKIVFTILKDVDDKFDARKRIMEANNGRYNISFVILDEKTNGPAETVYITLKKADICDEFAVKDSHVFLSLKKEYIGNFVAGLDLTQCEKTIDNLRSKSFISINEQGHILDIVEKHFCSDIISAGFYGFKSVEDYINAYEHLCDPNFSIEKLYLSHVISYLIGYSQRVFHRAEVNMFEDWSTSVAWQRVQKQNSICFLDMDTIEFDQDTLAKLRKLSMLGIAFIGYSCNDVFLKDYYRPGVNWIAVVPNCPKTKSRIIVNQKEDIDQLVLEV